MEKISLTGFFSENYSIPLWQGSRSNKFDFAQKHHYRRIDNFAQSNMIPKVSEHFVHQEKRHFTISRSKEKAFKFTDYYELYKQNPTEPLKYPKINMSRGILLSNKKPESLRKLRSKDRSLSVHPQNRSLHDFPEASAELGGDSKSKKTLKSKKHLLSQSHRPYNYDIVDFRDLLDQNKRSLRTDEKKSMKQIQFFSKRR